MGHLAVPPLTSSPQQALVWSGLPLWIRQVALVTSDLPRGFPKLTTNYWATRGFISSCNYLPILLVFETTNVIEQMNK